MAPMRRGTSAMASPPGRGERTAVGGGGGGLGGTARRWRRWRRPARRGARTGRPAGPPSCGGGAAPPRCPARAPRGAAPAAGAGRGGGPAAPPPRGSGPARRAAAGPYRWCGPSVTPRGAVLIGVGAGGEVGGEAVVLVRLRLRGDDVRGRGVTGGRVRAERDVAVRHRRGVYRHPPPAG